MGRLARMVKPNIHDSRELDKGRIHTAVVRLAHISERTKRL